MEMDEKNLQWLSPNQLLFPHPLSLWKYDMDANYFIMEICHGYHYFKNLSLFISKLIHFFIFTLKSDQKPFSSIIYINLSHLPPLLTIIFLIFLSFDHTLLLN